MERHIVQLVIAGDGQRSIEARAADDAARQRAFERDGVHLGKRLVVDSIFRRLARPRDRRLVRDEQGDHDVEHDQDRSEAEQERPVR